MTVSHERFDRTWAAGSYLDFLLASALMLLAYILSLAMVYQFNHTWYVENMDLIEHIGYIVVGMGWMAAIMLAIGFGLMPFIHQITPYDQSILRLCIALNISGQALLIAALFTFDRESIISFGTVGVTLLSLQFIVLAAPAKKLQNHRATGQDAESAFSTHLPMMTPIIGIACLFSWLSIEMEISRLLFEAILIDVFIPIIIVATILGHFNRRLEWNYYSKKGATQLFRTLTILGLTHVAIVWGLDTGRLSDSRFEYSLPLLYSVAFLGCRPDRIWANVLAKRPHSHLLLAAHAWMLIAIIMSAMEIREGRDPTHGRHIMLLGVGTMSMWGFAHWMHYDHCHIPLNKRVAGWPLLIAMSLSMALYSIGGIDVMGFLDVPLWERKASLGMAVFGMVYTAVWWFWETFFHLGEWHRIPMYYGSLHHETDPYELSSEE